MSKKAKRWWLWGIITVVILAVLVVGGIFGIRWANSAKYGPENEVEDYLQALVDGKASDALDIMEPNVVNDQQALLADDVYAAAENRPTDFDVTDIDVDGDDAVVEVEVTQNGKTYEQEFELEKSGKHYVVFDEWEMASGPEHSITMLSGPSEMQVNEVDVELPALSMSEDIPSADEASSLDGEEATDEDLADSEYPVLPGEYVFTAPEGSKYVSYGESQTIEVLPDENDVEDADEDTTPAPAGEVSFAPTYTSDVITDATAKVEDRISSCLADKTIRIEDCEAASWEDTSWEAMRNINRSWATNPDPIVISEDDSEYYSGLSQEDADQLHGDLAVVIDGGTIEVEYDRRDDSDEDWNSSSATYQPFEVSSDDGWSTTGMVFPITIDGDELSVDMSALDEYNSEWLTSEFRD